MMRAVACSGPAVVVPTASNIFDFMAGSVPATVTFARASAAWYFNSSGNLAQASSGAARFDYGTPGSTTLQGMLMEAAATNQALRCRDLTQAAWTKSNATAALDQTGIDAGSNAASSLTATGANATALQTVTQAATSSVFSIYLKRLTGTGTIQLTQDGGTTYTTVTLTGSWQRFQLPAQSTLNPQFGIKIVTSGDSVAWDCAQFEAGPCATSPILTTTASVTRALETAQVAGLSWADLNHGTLVGEVINGANASGGQAFVSLSNNTINNRVQLRVSLPTTPSTRLVANSVSISSTNGTAGAFPLNVINKMGVWYSPAGHNYYLNGSSFNSGTTAPVFSALNQLDMPTANGAVGSTNTSSVLWLRKVSYWNTALTNAQLQKATL